MVQSANLPVLLLVPFLPMVTKKNPERFSAANDTIGTNGTIGRSHGGIFIILINTSHLFLSFLFTFVYCVIFKIYICMYDISIAYLQNS